MLAGNKVLEDQHTIQQEGIVDNDQFLICKKRRNMTSHVRKSFSYSTKGPDLQLIKKCTEHLGIELILLYYFFFLCNYVYQISKYHFKFFFFLFFYQINISTFYGEGLRHIEYKS